MKVILYSEPVLQGNTQELKLGAYKVSELEISQLGSLQLPHWLRVIFYKDEAYGVQMAVFNGDSQSIAERVDGAQALVVEPLPNFDFALVARHSQKILQVEDGSTADGAYVVQHGFTGGQHQRIRLAPVVDDPGFFKITFPHSNKVLGTAPPAKGKPLSPRLQQQVWEKKDSQKWGIHFRDQDHYLLINKQSPNAIAVPNQRGDDNLVVETYPVNGHLHQQFRVERVINDKLASSYLPKGNEEYSIYTRRNKAIGIADNATTEAAAVIQHAPRANIYSQRFQFANARLDRYKIKNTHSDKFIGVASDRTGNGAPITQEEWQGRALQEWRLALQEDGYFRFLLGGTASNMDLANGSSADGAKLQQWAINSNLGHQSFRLELLPAVVNLKVRDFSAERATEKVNLSAPQVTAGSEQGAFAYYADEALTKAVPDPAQVGAGAYWIKLTTPDNRAIAKLVTVPPFAGYPEAGKEYCIYPKSGNFVLGTVRQQTQAGARVIQQTFALDRYSQRFELIELGEPGLYKIKNTISGRFLSVPANNNRDDEPATLEDWHDQAYQKWKFSPREDGYYLITVQHSNKALDVHGRGKLDGAYLKQFSTHEQANQLFRFEPLPPLPMLVITNPSEVRAETAVDLTDPAITRGSEAGTFAYFRDREMTQQIPAGEKVGPGEYWIKLTTSEGRSVTKPVNVPIQVMPQLVSHNPAPVCWDEVVDLTADAITAGSDQGQLSYFIDESLTQEEDHPEAISKAGTYYIKLTTPDGRTAVKPVAVTIHPVPILEVLPLISICWDQKADLTQAVKKPIQAAEGSISIGDQHPGQPSEEIAYFADSDAKQAIADPKNVPAGTYYIQRKTEQGCSIIKPVQVAQKKKPLLEVANPPAVCWDQKANLRAEGVIAAQDPGEIAYFKDEAASVLLDDPTAVEAGDYFIQLKTVDGCTVVEKVTATIYPKPKLEVHNPQPVCGVTSYNLKAPEVTTGSDPGTLSYFKDEALTQAVEKPEAVGAGTFYIQLKTEKGCTVSSPVTTEIYPIPELALEEPKPVCNGMTFKLREVVVTPIEPSDQIEYAGKDQQFAILAPDTAVKAGTYQIRRTNQFGCSTTAEVEIKEHPVPRLRLQETEWAYRPETIDLTAPYLTAGSDEGRLSFFRDERLQSPLSEQEAKSVGAGTYYLQLTSPHGCKSEVQKITTALKDRPSIAVPIHVDARYVEKTEICVSPRLDFSRLPYYDGERDVNPYTPYLGEELEAVPFKNGEFELEKGMHLHWALPDFLTKSFRYPMLDLSALRRATRTNRLGETDEQLYDELLGLFAKESWIKPIPDNEAYASILAEEEKVDITISELLSDADAEKRALGQEVLRVRSLLEPGGTQMPPVPNRWRVYRVYGERVEKDWTIESDFLRHADYGDYQTGVPFPHPNPQPEQPPYGWLGRNYGTGHGKPQEDKGSYLDMPLTTLGYGDATFAAFYPNCHSVFGLHDDTVSPEKGYTYEIYGYYAEENRSYEYFDLQRRDVINRTESLPERRQVLSELLKGRFGLEVEDTAPGVWPDRLVCCGKIHVKASKAAKFQPPDITVTVGSTSTEAVSAFLANRISKDKKLEVEEYLESLQYLKRLEHLKTDIGPKLLEERHRQSFTSDKGGYRWVLVPKNKSGEEVGKQIEQVVLTDDKANFLHELNELQLAFDRTDAQIKSLRRQIFADWSKYMLCQYPPDGADDEYPDADQARFFIEFELMPWLEELNGKRQELAKGIRDHLQSFWHFQPGDIQSPAGLYQAMMAVPRLKPWLDREPQAAGSVAALARVLNQYIDQNGYHQENLPADGETKAPKWSIDEILDQQKYQHHLIKNRLELEANFPAFLAKHPDTILRRKPHRPFHRPADPVVMITGDALKTTRKHGQDGQLPHTLEVVKDLTALLALASKSTKGNTNIVPDEWQQVPDRHPLLLDWLVEFFPVEDTDFNLDSYEPDYLLDKYTLDINKAELRATKEDLYAGVGQSFWGSSILASSGSKTLKQSLETFLIGELQLTEADLEDITAKREAFFQNDPWVKKYPDQPVTVEKFDAFYSWAPVAIAPSDLSALWAAKHKALALMAYEQLRGTHFLSQAMGGFTPALLMMREGYQLKIADPLGYPEYQEFSRKVSEVVGLMNHASTLPNNPFFPIRAGEQPLSWSCG